MSNYVPWKPGDLIGPPRFGLTPDQWVKILHLQHRYATNSHGDRDRLEYVPSPRMAFTRWLRQTGRLRDG